ncbi:hypothetical protein CABS01_10871 [Colletotrichum abscissum]|uniref:Uncharacterized protein n=3 Tax=Colletotrichum acutatum species complex TaxID=2707335 RepID=A0A9Q0B8M8_9PEZI|nr:uncharacterized protein CLUP02_16167 [Colletotrichum lupini]XP_060398950.1 uncharacterized protein CABS01_10871 [Colletotrichum abscissum]KAK1448618.1 hypothetical protein CMEL01_07933 [Colletotrichum melonis]KAI3557283.1 hypothetical protein CABS02_02387 [Colletotrichum abscissum]KAK1497893.1 hypothetical protein CABS01_10871 [Colletotrichum abscissum]KAK1710660.1 hypothetical protein BDP67DRAFT_579599 [Colletotrichum lupini]UQC90637.1 hypothetical protein CLUP02_16167 [Colletotrichum lup
MQFSIALISSLLAFATAAPAPVEVAAVSIAERTIMFPECSAACILFCMSQANPLCAATCIGICASTVEPGTPIEGIDAGEGASLVFHADGKDLSGSVW